MARLGVGIRAHILAALERRADSAYKHGRLGQSRLYVIARRALGGSKAWAEHYLGCLDLRAGKPARALVHLNASLAARQGDPRVLANLVRCQIDLNDWEEAARVARDLLLTGSLDWRDSCRIGRGLVESAGDHAGALPWFELAAVDAPEQEWPQLSAAHCHRFLKQHAAASQIYSRLAAEGQDPFVRVQAKQGLSDLKAEEGEFDQAKLIVEEILADQTAVRIMPEEDLEKLRDFHSWLAGKVADP